jgi:hypothetical protein
MPIAALMQLAVNGKSRSRAPVALATALAIAAAVGPDRPHRCRGTAGPGIGVPNMTGLK